MVEAIAIDRIQISRTACPMIQWDPWDAGSAAFASFAAERLGGALPTKVGETETLGPVTVVKAGPRRFWFLCAGRASLPRGLPPELGAELDLSEGRERLVVRTPHLRDVLSQCMAIDWNETLGRAAFASLHRIPVMFMRHSVEEGIFVVPRTFTRSVVEWLEGCR
jgi:heterotetrameric sarcosine oxidase gamma subunit